MHQSFSRWPSNSFEIAGRDRKSSQNRSYEPS